MESTLEISRVIGSEASKALFQWCRIHVPTAYATPEALCCALSSGSAFYQVRLAGETIGFYSLEEKDSGRLAIRDFQILSHEERVASEVLEFLLGQAGDAGYREVQIALPAEPAAKRSGLFRKHSFKPERTSGDTLLLCRKLQ